MDDHENKSIERDRSGDDKRSEDTEECLIIECNASRAGQSQGGSSSGSSDIVDRKSCGIFQRTFLLLDELGRGGYGFVYRCVNKKTRRAYAVKMNIDPKDMADLKEEYVMINEICQPLGHDNIVNVISSIADDRIVYNIYELASGGDLNSHLKRKGFYSEPQAVNIARQLFLGVSYIHSKGYLHRDIKPHNLLILNNSSSVHIKISDFGLAIKRRIRSNSNLGYMPGKHGYAGTVKWMSPEVFHDGIYDYDCDVWSCGVVLYQMLSGYVPFKKDPEITKEVRHRFPMPEWRNLDFAIDLISKLFDRSKKHLINTEDALSHKFFNRQNFDKQTLQTDKSSAMAHFLSMNRLKSELAQVRQMF